MKYTNKKTAGILLLISIAVFFTACSSKTELTSAYQLSVQSSSRADGFSKDLCIGTDDVESDGTDIQLAEAAGLFDMDAKSIDYAKNIDELLYPASTTKILTAYVALKYGNLSDMVTVSEQALDLEAGSSLCGFEAGDTASLEDLIYGLMIVSGNEAAAAIAEHISGDQQAFVDLMNEEAKRLGATHSHFMNPHGLHDEEHYTTAYDLYLMFQAAIQDERFLNIIKTTSYTTRYQKSDGSQAEMTWDTTNLFLTGDQETPEHIAVLGGKTGTTKAAGSCLVLLSENSAGNAYISVILNAEDRPTLYTEMADLLVTINK